MTKEILAVTDETFEHEVLESLQPVVVDFWAPWCAPCGLVEPILNELALEYNGKYKFVRMNTDENSKIQTEYAIRSIPTLGFFRNGRMIDIILGARPKAFIIAKLDENLIVSGDGQENGTELFSNELY